VTAAALYRAPWFLALARLSKGSAWTLHASASALLQEQGTDTLSEDLAELALACLPQRARALALRSLLAVGLWVRTPGGYRLHSEPSAEVRPEAPSAPPSAPLSAAERTRAWRQRRASQPTSQATSQPTSPTSHGASQAPSQPTISAGFATSHDVTGNVTQDVTSRARTHEENSPSPSPSPSLHFQKEEGEERRERRISPLPPAAAPAAPASPFLAAVLASIPSTLQAPEGDPIEVRTTAAAALWAEMTGRTVSALAPRDLDAIRVRVQERATAQDFRAAFGWATSEPWYGEGDRSWPRLVCGSKWEECRRKGRRSNGNGPSSSPRPPAGPPVPPAPPSPRPEPPETLPYGGPYAHPTRLRDHLGARYQPLPAEGIYLRQDLYMARLNGQKAAAE